MRIELEFKPKVVLALLIVAIFINLVSIFFLRIIEAIVHGTLYNYGLQFSLNWATPYWNNSHILLFSIITTVALLGLSIAATVSYARKHTSFAKSLCYLLTIAGMATGIISTYFFNNIDLIVNGDLYQYGLTFSNEWADVYWIYERSTIIFLLTSSLLAFTSFILILIGSRKRVEITAAKVIPPTLSVLGIISLIYSVILSNSILALVGLGLIFWGIVFGYIRTEDYAKKTVMDLVISSQKSTINQILKQFSFSGKPIYLPPKYFKDSETSKAFIPKNQESPLPLINAVQEQENMLFTNSPSGILLTTSGAGLVKLFERTLETNFTRVDLQYLQQNLPKTIIENLEIAQNIEIKSEKNKIKVSITNSIYPFSNPTFEKLQTGFEMETPLTSAIACSIAKATGQPVRVEKTYSGNTDRDFIVEFSLLGPEVSSK